MAQWNMGKAGSTYYHGEAGMDMYQDTRKNREAWFKQCLEGLESWCITNHIKTVAFPYKIGCGLAGGDWKHYLKMITDFAEENSHLQVTIYTLEEIPELKAGKVIDLTGDSD
jgi:hypothetical protein